MKTKVLYVDPFSPIGHLNFNRIYLSALAAIPNVQIDVLFQENYLNQLGISKALYNKAYTFSSKRLNVSSLFSKFLWRIYHIKILHICRKLQKINEYDFILFSSFDEILLSLFKPKGNNIIAVCHSKATHIVESRLILFLLRKLSRQIYLVTISKSAFEYLKGNDIENLYIPHGFPVVNQINSTVGRFIFIPIKALIDTTLLKDMITPEFSKLLHKLDVKLYLRRQPYLETELQNIIYINGYISDEEYERLFNNAGLILLPYNKNAYAYRTSAMLMETIVYGKYTLIPEAESFKSLIFDGDNGIVMYKSKEDILHFIENFFEKEEHLPPNYKNVLKENSSQLITKSLKNILYDEKN